jgi:hypothetical protein
MTDQPLSATNPLEAKSDTYHDQDSLTRIAVYAERISWVFLALTILVAGVIFYLIYLTATGRIGTEQLMLNLPSYLVPFFLGGFFWVLLRLISEGTYILMDIEDNTRQPTSPEGS